MELSVRDRVHTIPAGRKHHDASPTSLCSFTIESLDEPKARAWDKVAQDCKLESVIVQFGSQPLRLSDAFIPSTVTELRS